MLNPKEISQKKFEKALGFGYRMDDVDEYLETVANEMQCILECKADLEKKLEVLADKLTEYREDEESLRTAILSAQKLGDNVIRESKTKAEIIMRDATIKADALVGNAKRQIQYENDSLKKLQSEVASFKNRLIALYRQHLELITALPGDVENNSKPKEKENSSHSTSAPKVKEAKSNEQQNNSKDEDSNSSDPHFSEVDKSILEKVEDKKEQSETIKNENRNSSEQLDSAKYEEKKNKYSQPPIKRFVVGDDDIPDMPSDNNTEKTTLDTPSLKSVFNEDDIDSDELDLSFFNKANSQVTPKNERNLRFGESFKIKRDSSFPRFR